MPKASLPLFPLTRPKAPQVPLAHAGPWVQTATHIKDSLLPPKSPSSFRAWSSGPAASMSLLGLLTPSWPSTLLSTYMSLMLGPAAVSLVLEVTQCVLLLTPQVPAKATRGLGPTAPSPRTTQSQQEALAEYKLGQHLQAENLAHSTMVLLPTARTD